MSLVLFDLTGRRALITGSGQGIGLALAFGLGRAGAEIVINGRDPARLDAALAALRKDGINAAASAFDVTDHDAVVTAVNHIESTLGAIDILVNNAGIQRRGTLEEYPVETWH
ncbi:MAG TPA: SDR family NAD(P)-dependent oxidoreductase, partial [Acidisphaera sp.]|nr:SDR family NAD(P)-dependent oxidoreductase [Acidisphaera sp.]